MNIRTFTLPDNNILPDVLKGAKVVLLKDVKKIIDNYCRTKCCDLDPLSCQGCPLWEKVMKK